MIDPSFTTTKLAQSASAMQLDPARRRGQLRSNLRRAGFRRFALVRFGQRASDSSEGDQFREDVIRRDDGLAVPAMLVQQELGLEMEWF